MKIGIVAEFDCLLVVESDSFLLKCDESRVEIEINEKKNVNLLVYPTAKKHLISYAVSLVCKADSAVTSSENVSLFQVGDGLFELILKQNKTLAVSGKKSYNFQKDGVALNVLSLGTSVFVVSYGAEKNMFEFNKSVKEIAFDVKNSVPYFVASTQSGKCVCLFCPIKQKFFYFDVQSVEVEGDVVSLVENLNTHSKHGRLTKLQLSQAQGVELLSSELLYLNGSPTLATNAKVLPFVFLESVKVGDFNLAKSFLSDDLSNVITEQMLKAYFGNFDRVFSYNYSSCNSCVCLAFGKKTKVFSFKVLAGKITEIDLVQEFGKVNSSE